MVRGVGIGWKYLVGTVVAGDLLAHDEDGLVAEHLLLHGGVEGLADGHLQPSVIARRMRSVLAAQDADLVGRERETGAAGTMRIRR